MFDAVAARRPGSARLHPDTTARLGKLGVTSLHDVGMGSGAPGSTRIVDPYEGGSAELRSGANVRREVLAGEGGAVGVTIKEIASD